MMQTVTAAFAPLHFTRITIPEKQMLELEGLEDDKIICYKEFPKRHLIQRLPSISNMIWR